MPEQLNYNEIAIAGFKYRWRDEKLYICEYLPDGQTRDDSLGRNPMGFAMMHNQNMLLRRKFKDKCLSAMQMTGLCIYAGNIFYLKESNCILATVLTLPLGILISIRRRQFAQLK